jgi:hypothetical protein
MSIKAEIKENKLFIEIDIQDPEPSKSGKTLTIASTRGNVSTRVIIHGQPLIIGLNAYIKR